VSDDLAPLKVLVIRDLGWVPLQTDETKPIVPLSDRFGS
jgi:hypothetical protein